MDRANALWTACHPEPMPSGREVDGRKSRGIGEHVAGGDSGRQTLEEIVEGARAGGRVGGLEMVVGVVETDNARRLPAFFGSAGADFEESVGA